MTFTYSLAGTTASVIYELELKTSKSSQTHTLDGFEMLVAEIHSATELSKGGRNNYADLFVTAAVAVCL